jgi:hypothetical protein
MSVAMRQVARARVRGSKFEVRSFQSFELRIAPVSHISRFQRGLSGSSGLSGLFCLSG